MKLRVILTGNLVALFIVLISCVSCEEDEIINSDISSFKEPEGDPSILQRVRRQIPFISKWFSSSTSDSSIGNNNRPSASSQAYSYKPKPAFRQPTVYPAVVANNGTVPPNGSLVADPHRDGRFLSLFTVVRFDNNQCLSQSGDNGTCYPNQECTKRGGAANGKCARGYGVCCVFSKTCGASTNQNNTYFTHSGYPTSYDGTGSCQLTVYKCAWDVCQYKLEFDSFNIAQPGINGICNNDQFIVSGSTTGIPIVCGVNTGNHMYIDVGPDNSPTTLSVVTSGPTFSRSWKIKITQIRCTSPSKDSISVGAEVNGVIQGFALKSYHYRARYCYRYPAPEGCLQYHQGVSGILRSYNFDFTGGQQLSNQDFSACVRMERNFCGIRYTACTDNVGFQAGQQQQQRSRAFSLTGQLPNIAGALVGAASCNTDWITIPCATNTGRVLQMAGAVCQDRICGDTFNSEASQVQMPVFSFAKPFRVYYHTDANENNDLGNRGFCLNYIQQPCTPQQ